MRSRSYSILLFLCGGLALVLCGLMIANPLDGEPKADLLHFIGRFHPTVLHLPIGFILLLAILEFSVTSRRFESLKPAIPLVLTLSIVSVLLAVFTGFLLAYASGANEHLVLEHMEHSIHLAIGLLAMGALKLFWEKRPIQIVYRVLLGLNLILLGIASHDGGSLTHGRDYLTKYMPDGLKSFIGLEVEEKIVADSAANLVVFADLVQPIVEQNCLSCHNPDKLKGELNLETHEGYLEGGDLGPSVVPGNVDDSEFVFRITLPMEDDEFMPPEGKTPLTADEIALVSWWIENGASPTATVGSYESIPSQVDLYITQVFDSILTPEEIEALEAERLALYAELEGLNQELGILVTPIENGASLFRLDTFSAHKSFDDQMLEKLAPYADRIVELDLSDTRITDSSFKILARFSNLRSLNLSKTDIEGKGIDALAKIESLETLNLYGSNLKTDNASEVETLIQLKRLYLFQTDLYTKEDIERLREALPDCQIDRIDT